MAVPDVRNAKALSVLSGGYRVTPFPDQKVARLVVKPRRGASLSTPGLLWPEQLAAQDAMFAEFGLDELRGCITAEMRHRPVPQVFETYKTKPITDLFRKWAPRIYARILPAIMPPVQVLNKTSSLGWPHFNSPESKRKVMLDAINAMVAPGGLEKFRSGFIVPNVRLQPESRHKKREFLYVDARGKVFPKETGEKERTIRKPAADYVASRTRLVFNLPLPNLFTQVLDTAVNTALLQHKLFKHNMYDPALLGFKGDSLFFDVKHFERATAEIVRARAQIFGGLYADIGQMFSELPFLCPSSDWKVMQLMWVARAEGFSDQFASGYSPVSPSQKEILLVVICEFAVVELGMNEEDAITWALAGGDSRLSMRNSGDDNAYGGDSGLLDAIFTFVRQYLDAEEEEPPKFLGFLHQNGFFKLGISSYVTKTYLNERAPGSNFRKFPFYGWVLKRQIYQKYGEEGFVSRVFPFEDALLASLGLPWSKVVELANTEASEARSLAGLTNLNWVMGKDYLMTPEEKLQTGVFEGFTIEETAPMIKHLLSKEWVARLQW